MRYKVTRKRFIKKPSKYEKEATLAEGIINKIEYKNLLVNEKYKSVFYVPSYLCPQGRMCVFWGYTTINTGDKVEMKGRFSDGVFLVWSLKIHKRAKLADGN